MNSKARKYKIFSLVMALLILITSVGFSLDIHYCNGQLKSVSFFGKAKSCHDNSVQKSCSHHKELQKDNDCCENRTFVFQSDLDKDLDSKVFTLPVTKELSSFIVAFTIVSLNLYPKFETNIIESYYSNPIIHRDIYVLFETFLI